MSPGVLSAYTVGSPQFPTIGSTFAATEHLFNLEFKPIINVGGSIDLPISGSSDKKTIVFFGGVGTASSTAICSVHNAGTFVAGLQASATGELMFFPTTASSITLTGLVLTIVSGTTADYPYFTAVATYDGSTATLYVKLRSTGVIYYVQGSVTGSNTFSSFRVGPILRNRQVNVAMQALLDHAATPIEALSLLNNPWQVFAPDARTIWGPA
jgi:hypothetical protein